VRDGRRGGDRGEHGSRARSGRRSSRLLIGLDLGKAGSGGLLEGGRRERLEDAPLDRVGVLELIDEDLVVARRDRDPQPFVGLQPVGETDEDVVEVEIATVLLAVLVGGGDGDDPPLDVGVALIDERSR
jgi:hypothetical protein